MEALISIRLAHQQAEIARPAAATPEMGATRRVSVDRG